VGVKKSSEGSPAVKLGMSTLGGKGRLTDANDGAVGRVIVGADGSTGSLMAGADGTLGNVVLGVDGRVSDGAVLVNSGTVIASAALNVGFGAVGSVTSTLAIVGRPPRNVVR
jgi:hypothetical protein